jgi:polyphosphate kinase
LEFNFRVLEQAFDDTLPLLERLKFLCIFSSNLDEFFMIRVAGLKEQEFFRSNELGPDRMSPTQQLEEISRRVHEYVDKQYRCYKEDIRPSLSKNGIHILDIDDLNDDQHEFLREYWEQTLFPILTPLAVDPSHPFPKLPNNSLNLVVELKSPDSDRAKVYFAFVTIPKVVDRLVNLPKEQKNRVKYVLLEDVITEFIGDLFPGLDIVGISSMKVSRNSDLDIVEEEASDLLKAIQQEVRRRDQGNIVRMELSNNLPSPMVMEILKKHLNIEEKDIYYINGPLDLKAFFEVYNNSDEFPNLKYDSFIPYDPVANQTKTTEFYELLKKKDILLYHPYDSFQSVIDFISDAAEDPAVLAIKQTLYRTGKESPFVKALIKAAENGKQVTALVEIKARFDEESNINWAKKLEEAGVNVVYGLIGLKTHCKMGLVVRRESSKIRKYIHLSTGNYNHITAKLYSDIGFFTSKKSFSDDVLVLFNVITGYANLPPLKKLVAAPINLKERMEEMILRERDNCLAGKESRIIAKMNSLSDTTIIKALYKASMAGVKIDLIVRGICCLIPGVPGLSDNIRVYSIIDRFLEHSRVFYFSNKGADEIYLSSADWRPRNMERRIEVMFPVEDEILKNRLINEILLPQIRNRKNCYKLTSDGTYTIGQSSIEKPFSYQTEMINISNIRKKRENVLLQGISSELIKRKKKKK